MRSQIIIVQSDSDYRTLSHKVAQICQICLHILCYDIYGVLRPLLASGEAPKGIIMRILASLAIGIGLVALMLGLLVTGSTFAIPELQICNVPGDYITIQAAVDDPVCEVIDLANGTFTETVTIDRSLTIQGQGSSNTTIDGDAKGSVFTIQPGNTVSITDVTITNGLSIYGGGGGIRNEGSSLLVKSSLIISNSAILGGGIDSSTDSSSIECSKTHILDSIISNNQATDGPGGGISSYSTPNCNNEVIIENSQLSENSTRQNYSGGEGGAIFLVTGPTYISNSIITANKANTGGGITAIGGQLTIISSQVTNNQAYFGGGVFTEYVTNINVTTLISDTDFSRNEALTEGGGILNGGEMKIVNSRLIENSAGLKNQGSLCGGAILNSGKYSNLLIESTEIRKNSAKRGGGVCNEYSATLEIVDSLLAGNTATGMEYFEDGGGAISNNDNSHVTITNSTLGKNEAAGRGGALYIFGEADLVNVTLNQNSAGVEGGGIFPNLSVNLANSIVANNGIGGDCAGQVNSQGHNIDSDGSCGLNAPGDQNNTDPLLGPLQDNGGPTDTFALLILSPAIDTGDDSVCPATDQRGVSRPIDGDSNGSAICDIGAYESEPFNLTDFVYIPTIKKSD